MLYTYENEDGGQYIKERQGKSISTHHAHCILSFSKYRNPEISTKNVFIAEKLRDDNQANPKSDSILKYIFLKTSTSEGGKEKNASFKGGLFFFLDFRSILPSEVRIQLTFYKRI